MYSKKPIWDFRVGIKTYKKFRVPKEMKKGYISTRSRQVLQHHNNKRARQLDWSLVMGFE